MPDLRPLKVAQTTTQLLQANHLKQQPLWLPTVSRIPPSSDLSRKPPPKFTKAISRAKKQKIFQPMRIVYAEDKLRDKFYREHPWELARPVLVLENSGDDHKSYNWSRLQQHGKQLTGESVVQRQMWLMNKESMTEKDSYLKATSEFYEARTFEAVEKRVAVEEALAFGADFNKFETQIGLELEDAVLKDWRKKAVAAKSLVSPVASKQKQDLKTLTSDVPDTGDVFDLFLDAK